MNEHEQIQELFSEYVEETLAAEQRRQVDAHLGQCASCQKALRALVHALQSVQALPKVKAPRGFAKRLHKRLQLTGLYRRRRQAQHRLALPHLAVLAIVLMLAALGMLIMLLLLKQPGKPTLPFPSAPSSKQP